jgi:hypothetical protein
LSELAYVAHLKLVLSSIAESKTKSIEAAHTSSGAVSLAVLIVTPSFGADHRVHQ